MDQFFGLPVVVAPETTKDVNNIINIICKAYILS